MSCRHTYKANDMSSNAECQQQNSISAGEARSVIKASHTVYLTPLILPIGFICSDVRHSIRFGLLVISCHKRPSEARANQQRRCSKAGRMRQVLCCISYAKIMQRVEGHKIGKAAAWPLKEAMPQVVFYKHESDRANMM